MAIIDWEQFNENFQYYDKTIIREVIDIFVDEYDDRIRNMKKNIEEKDFTNLTFNAHSFKSVIGNYMAPRAYEITRRLEESAKNNPGEATHEIFIDMCAATHELLTELKDYLQKPEE